MKTASLIAAVLLLLCWLVQYIYSRRYKREFDVLSTLYPTGPLCPCSRRDCRWPWLFRYFHQSQWFRWILCGKKIKVKKTNIFPPRPMNLFVFHHPNACRLDEKQRHAFGAGRRALHHGIDLYDNSENIVIQATQ